jgi:hypothetical protein
MKMKKKLKIVSSACVILKITGKYGHGCRCSLTHLTLVDKSAALIPFPTKVIHCSWPVYKVQMVNFVLLLVDTHLSSIVAKQCIQTKNRKL